MRFEIPRAGFYGDQLAAAFLKGEVLRSLGELEEAKRWYSLCPQTEPRSCHVGFALYRLGQVHEAMGEREQARERFEQFVDLWKDADPEFQLWVADARDRLAALGDTLPG